MNIMYVIGAWVEGSSHVVILVWDSASIFELQYIMSLTHIFFKLYMTDTGLRKHANESQ